jgi:hypothetical protein
VGEKRPQEGRGLILEKWSKSTILGILSPKNQKIAKNQQISGIFSFLSKENGHNFKIKNHSKCL